MTSGQPTNLHSEILRGGSFAPLFSFLCRSHSFFFSFFLFLSSFACFFLFLMFPFPSFFSFSLFLFPFARSFFSFSSFPFPLGAYLRPPVSDPPFGFFSHFLSFFFLWHALFSPFHLSRSLWAHICAHPLACAPPPLCKPPAPCPSNNIRCTAPACPLFCQTIRKLRIKSSFFSAKVWRESKKAIPLHSLFRNTSTVTH